MSIEVIGASLFGANCYVAWPDGGASALVVDPGPGTIRGVRRVLAANSLDVGAVLLTHGHIDHVWEAGAVAGDTAAVLVPGPDMYWLDDPAGMLGLDPDALHIGPWVRPAVVDEVPMGPFEPVPGLLVRMVPTPGHSPGSALFLFSGASDGPPTAFSGDVVFAGSVGRSDLPGGDEKEMRESLRTLAAALDPATILLPGHGPATTWQAELDANPFVRRAQRRL